MDSGVVQGYGSLPVKLVLPCSALSYYFSFLGEGLFYFFGDSFILEIYMYMYRYLLSLVMGFNLLKNSKYERGVPSLAARANISPLQYMQVYTQQ